MPEPGFDREACMWTSTVTGYNDRDRHRVIEVDGKRVVERIPQTGHLGSYDDRRPPQARRWLPFVRHEGHRVFLVFTNAAAHLDTSTPYAAMQFAMARHLGWFYVGACPLALIGTGELGHGDIVATGILKEHRCDPGSYDEDHPCKHALAEEAARKAKNAEINRQREAAFKDPAEKMVEAQREQTAAIVNALIARRDGDDDDEKPKRRG